MLADIGEGISEVTKSVVGRFRAGLSELQR